MQKKPYNPRYRGKHTRNIGKKFKRPVRLIQKGFKQPRKNFYFKLLRPVAARKQLHVNAKLARKTLGVVPQAVLRAVRCFRSRTLRRTLSSRPSPDFAATAGLRYARVVRGTLFRKSSTRVLHQRRNSYASTSNAQRLRTVFYTPTNGFRARTVCKKEQVRRLRRSVAGGSPRTLRGQYLSQYSYRYARGIYRAAGAGVKGLQSSTRLKLRFRAVRLDIGFSKQHRRRGKRAYAGLVGKRRWRTERRDKFLLRRAIKRQVQQAVVLKVAHRVYRKAFARNLHQIQASHAILDNVKNSLASRSRLRSRLAAISLRAARRFFSPHNSSGEVGAYGLNGARLRGEHRRVTVNIMRVLPRWRRLRAKRSVRRSVRVRILAHTRRLAARRSSCRLAAHCSRTTRGASYEFIKSAAAKPVRLRRLAFRLKVVPGWLKPQLTPRILGRSSFSASVLRFKRTKASARIRRLVRQQLLRGVACVTNTPPSRTLSVYPRVSNSPTVSYAEYAASAAQALHVTPRIVPAGAPSRPTFLSHLVPTRAARYAGNLRAAYRHLSALQRHSRERRFYLKRPRLRLPQTAVTRHRRRRGGLGLFARHSLKTPRTRAGVVSQLLPPQVTYSRVRAVAAVGALPTSADFIESSHHDDLMPRIWRRPPSWKNLRGIYYVRKRRYVQHKLYGHKLSNYYKHYRRVPVGASKLAALPAKLNKLRLPARVDRSLAASGFSALRESGIRVATRRHTAEHATNALVRSTDIGVFSSTTTGGVKSDKSRGLWYARSVRSMQKAERALTAWSPQFQLKWRRRSHPRINGLPLRRRWLGFKAMRARAQQNAALAFRGLPQKRYLDLNYLKLQYYLGSVASVGYARLRRSHRFPSSYNRWWRPVKYSVPFAHPFSRRSLTAKRFYRGQFLPNEVPSQYDLGGAMNSLTARGVKTKLPGRTIPWRNFSYSKPKYKPAPATLQRWTYVTTKGETVVSKAKTANFVLVRTPRELRALESAMPLRNIWKDRQWELLERRKLPTRKLQVISQAIAAIPSAVWSALRSKAGSLTRYSGIRGALLLNFRRWVGVSASTSTAARTLPAAINFLLRTLHQIISQTQLSEVPQYELLAGTAFTRKLSVKRNSFWSLRVEPTLYRGGTSLTSRENGAVYKRWLRGAEQALQLSTRGHTPASRSRYFVNSALEFGRRRLRFPASGRRRQSYDSMLHAFAKRISPSRMRRAASMRVKRVKAKLVADFRENLAISVSTVGLQRRKLLVRKLNSVSYPSPVWRELLARRNTLAETTSTLADGAVFSTTAKRRFASVPLRRVFRCKRISLVRKQPRQLNQLRMIRFGIMRRALRRRRDERTFVDLRKSVLQRRLPKERASRPRRAWVVSRRKRNARLGSWSRRALESRDATTVSWGLRHLGTASPRIDSLAATVLNSLPSGEELSPALGATRLKSRAKQDFGVFASAKKPKKSKRRSRNRDSRKWRRRTSRRRGLAGPIAAMRQVRHWSESKDFGKVADLPSARQLVFSKRFFTSTRRLHNVRLGAGRLIAPASGLALGKVTPLTHKRPYRAIMGQPSAAVSSVTLRVFTSLKRRKRCFRLRKHALTRLSRVRRAGAARALRRVQRTIRRKCAVQRSTVARQLVEHADVFPLVTPLYFQRPTLHVVKTAKAKEGDILADIASKEARYKTTAQYVESLTEFIPELINYMLSKKIKTNKKLSYSTAQHIVRNIYWSLRVYLNVDPFDTRFMLRDKKPAARLLLSEDVSDLAETQLTDQPKRAELRYRFQPGRLLVAPNTMRFRGDWLRAFLPAKHALYQEDPEDYGMFLLKTCKIRQLRMHGRGIADWVTTHQQVGHETRARQLLTLRYSKAKPRFETLLQTTRRIAQKERSSSALVGQPRTLFFARTYSTGTKRSFLTSEFIGRRKRFVAFDERWRTVSPLVAVRSRTRVMARIEARGRTNYVASSRPAISGSLLDVRFTRAKSPRSRQYVLRRPVALLQAASTTSSARVRKLHRARSRRLAPLGANHVTRSTRRAVYLSPHRLSASLQNTPLGVARFQSSLRREFVRLRAKQIAALPPVISDGGLSTPRLPVNAAPVVSQLRNLRQRLAHFSSQGRHGATRLALNERPFLREHASSTRSVQIKYRLAATLQSGAITVRPRLARLQRRWAKSFRQDTAEFLNEANLLPVSRRSALLERRSPRVHFGRNSAGFVLATNRRRVHPMQRKPFVRRSVHFRNVARKQGAYNLHFTARCVRTVRSRRQTPFETYRPRLWDKLSLRWMKRYRIARYWIKDTGRWLRDPWLSPIVSCEPKIRSDRHAGELRAREQQIGQYVPEVDSAGRDISAADAPFRERHPLTRRPNKEDPAIKVTEKALKRGVDAAITHHRLRISKAVQRKPVPSMWLANYEYRDVIREHKEEAAKPSKQRAEEEQARIAAYWERKAQGLPEDKPRRLPLKHPSNLWLPHTIWKEIQRRVRKFEWRESDEVFFRKGFRTAFRFYPQERNTAPWLEALMYTRATYSTRLREFRRRQFPHEQKKFKWLQRVRKALFPTRFTRYIRKRKWTQLRRYNQKLHYSLFKLPTRRAARKHFKKLNRRSRPAVSGFASASRGLINRLDNVILQLGFVPSIYWARVVAPFGLVRVNGTTIRSAGHLLAAGDQLQVDWDAVHRFQHFFKPYLRNREAFQQRNRKSTAFYPTNIEYHRGTRTLVYTRLADEADFRKSSRIRGNYFRWFKLDSI